jgi:sigma-54 specific flagellar transcriptional regulator A
MQVKLLRVLQQKSFERVGSNETRTADVRIIAATHRDLEEEVRAGRFREDLFFRLNVFPIQMPALRDRSQDLSALIDTFHLQLEQQGHHPVNFSGSAMDALRSHEWPGNVRELQNLLERLSVMMPGRQVAANDLPERYRPAGESPAFEDDRPVQSGLVFTEPVAAPLDSTHIQLPNEGLCLKQVLTGIERELVKQALDRTAGVVSQAARLLGLGRTTLLEKIRKLDLTNTP